MIRLIGLLLLAITSQTLVAMETFDADTPGVAPNHWTTGITGYGAPIWNLERDHTAPSPPLVLKQSGKGDFPWCVKKGSYLADGFVAVKFKPISGKDDQAAGLIWRWKDAENYYVARANALENNISIYYVKEGQRKTILYSNLPDHLSVKRNVWQDFSVDFHGNHFRVNFEGETIIDLKDNHIKTGGAVGLWTKADSITAFDDFSYGKTEIKK